MMRLIWRLALVLGGALIAGGVARVMDDREGPVVPPVPLQRIWVVRQAVPAGRPLAAGDVALEPWPVAHVPEGTLGVDADPRGRSPRVSLLPGEPLLLARLHPRGVLTGTAGLPVPAGRRAVTVAVDEVVGVAGFVVPGTRVDVIATMDLDGMPTSRVILEDLVVLAVAQEAVGNETDKPRIVPSATLAVTPEEATRLILASDRGRIRLAMRAPEDAGRRQLRPPGLTARRLLDASPHRMKTPVPVVRIVVRTPRPVVTLSPTDPPVPVHRGPRTEWTRAE